MTFGNIIGIVTVYIVTGYPFLIHSAPLHHKYAIHVVMCCLCHVDAMFSVLSVVYTESKEITSFLYMYTYLLYQADSDGQ